MDMRRKKLVHEIYCGNKMFIKKLQCSLVSVMYNLFWVTVDNISVVDSILFVDYSIMRCCQKTGQ